MKLTDLFEVESLDEGWINHKNGTFSADASMIDAHQKDGGTSVRCPACRKPLNFSKFVERRDRENDITEWKYTCPDDGAKMIIFNT